MTAPSVEPRENASPESGSLVSPQRLRALRAAAGVEGQPLLIAVHDYPDPDAIASALAMQTLAASWGVKSVIAHGGFLGRAENAEMVRLLKIDIRSFSSIEDAAGAEGAAGYRGAVFLDTQPAARNQSLPPAVPVLAVIDHHALCGVEDAACPPPRSPRGTTRAVYSDIRLTVGASSTLMAGYLAAAGLVPDARLATALFLGIQTDTDGLLRDATPADVAAYTQISRLADLSLAARALHPPLDASFYRFLHAAAAGAGVFGGAVITDCGDVAAPDILSAASDYLIPLKGVRHALAVGFKDGRAFLSLRSRPDADGAGADATRVLLRIVEPEGKGGGHNRSAGGSIALPRPRETLFETIRVRFLEATGDSGASRKALIE